MDVIEQVRLDILLAQQLAAAEPGDVIHGYEVVSIGPVAISNDVVYYDLVVYKDGRLLKSTFTRSFLNKDPERIPYRREEPIFIHIK